MTPDIVMRTSLAKVLTDMNREDFERFRARGREVITTSGHST